MPSPKALAARVAMVALAAVVLALLPVTAAEAADEVRVSTDGTTWSSGLASPLFGTVLGLVPEESRGETLWVQNSSAHEVTLRITLDSSTWTDADLAAALTIGAAAPGANGTTAQASSTGTCIVLLSGATLDAGESIPVTITLALGSLSGRIGQDATVSMALGVTIFETGGATAPGSCAPTVVVPATPAAGTGTGTGGGNPPAAVEQEGESEADPQPQPGQTQDPGSPLFVLASLVGFNDSPLLWALIAALGGGAIFYLLEYSPWGRSRHRDIIDTPTDSDERQLP